jgi:hypothetical protein
MQITLRVVRREMICRPLTEILLRPVLHFPLSLSIEVLLRTCSGMLRTCLHRTLDPHSKMKFRPAVRLSANTRATMPTVCVVIKGVSSAWGICSG